MTDVERYYVEEMAQKARKTCYERAVADNNFIVAAALDPDRDNANFSPEELGDIVSICGGRLVPVEGTGKTRLRKETDNRFSIFYHGDSVPASEVFHELGHVYMEWTSMQPGDERFCDGVAARDVRATLFARAFVMPRNIFENAVIKNSHYELCDIRNTAEFLSVDYFEVLARGKDLRIWK